MCTVSIVTILSCWIYRVFQITSSISKDPILQWALCKQLYGGPLQSTEFCMGRKVCQCRIYHILRVWDTTENSQLYKKREVGVCVHFSDPLCAWSAKDLSLWQPQIESFVFLAQAVASHDFSFGGPCFNPICASQDGSYHMCTVKFTCWPLNLFSWEESSVL